MNVVELDGKVYKADVKNKVTVIRFQFRNDINQYKFIDVLDPSMSSYEKGDKLVVKGSLSVFEKNEKSKYDRYFVYASEVRKL